MDIIYRALIVMALVAGSAHGANEYRYAPAAWSGVAQAIRDSGSMAAMHSFSNASNPVIAAQQYDAQSDSMAFNGSCAPNQFFGDDRDNDTRCAMTDIFDGGGTAPASLRFLSISATCPSGYAYSVADGQCKSNEPLPPPCAAGTTAASGYVNMGPNPALAGNRKACHGGCEVLFLGSYPERRALVNGKWNYFGIGSYERNGNSCTAANAEVSTNAPTNTCADGQVLGTFNGSPLCLNGGTGEPINPNTPKPSETSTTTTNTTDNPDGSTTKTETTTNADGSQTITTTTTQANGSSSTTKEEKPAPDEDPKKSFCEENPEADLCKKSDFGGGCGGFNCKGDVIQCAIAQEQHRRNCTLFDTTTALSDLGNQLASGADPEASQHPALASNRQVFDLSTSINTSKQYAGSCPADRSITVMRQAIAIPLSTLCPYFEMFGNVMIALALLGAARTVGVF